MSTIGPLMFSQSTFMSRRRSLRLKLNECRNGCASIKCRCATLDEIVESALVHPSSSHSISSQDTLVDSFNNVERTLGDTELSYFLPSRESGVNDMYLHLGCRVPPRLLQRERVRVVWAILRLRHPLLASSVEMHDYNDVRFVYRPPLSVEGALDDASSSLEFRTQPKDELLDSYLNGPRTLSNDRLSYLIISCDPNARVDEGTEATGINHEVMFCATHFLGDGMALHQFANDFFGLIGSSFTTRELVLTLSAEWQARCGKMEDQVTKLPSALEDRLPSPKGSLIQLASRVDFKKSQEKLIGGHTFPRRSGAPRRTIVPTVSIDEKRTKDILKRCKSHGVSISSALFSLCNIAWAKTSGQKPEMPTMMYSALNLRPYLMANKALNDSYWFLAIGYFNVILPGFIPRSGDLAPTFWHRARSAKAQSTDAAKNPMIVSRSREMARERGERARAWAKEDDDKERGIWVAPPPQVKKPTERPPSNALIGLSLLGNLDGMYKHSAFPDIHLHTLTTGSRQRAGGMLLFGYTFVGKLWLSLGYDENGFDKDIVERFWANVLGCINEFLVN